MRAASDRGGPGRGRLGCDRSSEARGPAVEKPERGSMNAPQSDAEQVNIGTILGYWSRVIGENFEGSGQMPAAHLPCVSNMIPALLWGPALILAGGRGEASAAERSKAGGLRNESGRPSPCLLYRVAREAGRHPGALGGTPGHLPCGRVPVSLPSLRLSVRPTPCAEVCRPVLSGGGPVCPFGGPILAPAQALARWWPWWWRCAVQALSGGLAAHRPGSREWHPSRWRWGSSGSGPSCTRRARPPPVSRRSGVR
ncbi:unnamed protein product [Amoebophrya sp. A120]|nr:unnamed protein product [Amoebophrya sp. A120]|eukprot:GSA120T00002658001.1